MCILPCIGEMCKYLGTMPIFGTSFRPNAYSDVASVNSKQFQNYHGKKIKVPSAATPGTRPVSMPSGALLRALFSIMSGPFLGPFDHVDNGPFDGPQWTRVAGPCGSPRETSRVSVRYMKQSCFTCRAVPHAKTITRPRVCRGFLKGSPLQGIPHSLGLNLKCFGLFHAGRPIVIITANPKRARTIKTR